MLYPRLLLPRIAVWRSTTDLHIGGADSQFVLNSVPHRLGEIIPLLDGYHSLDDLGRVCDPPWVSWLIEALQCHDLLADGVSRTPPADIRVEGTGQLADVVYALLPPPGLGQVLRIVAMPTVETDRVMVADLNRQRVPYLVLRADEHTASVGPFVIPGQTSCLTCQDLTRRALDPTWPVQVFQLARLEATPSTALCCWAGAMALAHATAYTRGLTPESASTTIELSAQDGRVTYRSWPIHPDCKYHR